MPRIALNITAARPFMLSEKSGHAGQKGVRGGIVPVIDCADRLPVDDKDRLLLSLLRRDSRRSVVDLARELNLSRTATQDRLSRLKSSGAIARFTIVEGDSLPREQAYLTITLDRGVRCAQLAPKLRKLPGIDAMHSVTGPIDMIIHVVADHVDGIEQVRSTVAALPGVADVATHVVLGRLVE